MATMTDTSYKVDRIVEELYGSLDRGKVESVFEKYEIDDFGERIGLLRKCMAVLDTSNTDDDLSLEDEYQDEVEIFLNPSWRFLN